MMDFTGPAGRFSINNFGWGHLLDLASQHGWEPAGVLPPEKTEEDEEGVVIEIDPEEHRLDPEEQPEISAAVRSMLPQSGDPFEYYCFNCGYRVTAEDAAALADALECSLPDIPDHDALGPKTYEDPRAPGVRLIPLGTPLTPYEYLSGKGKRKVEAFIAFCRQGGFTIW
jgi:hypothetical protein